MNYRKMTLCDVPAVALVEQSAPDAWGAAQLAEIAENNLWLCCVCEENGTICGAAFVQCAGDDAELHAVTVLPAFRRRGVATQMLQYLTDLCSNKGLTRMILEVRESNIAARAAYEKCGFTVLGVRKNFYETPAENAVIMEKHFS